MQRRNFIKTTSLFAIGTSAFGMIKWNGDHYEGIDPTTTDILGPFYRPGAPMRSNVIPAGVKGEIVELSGIVFKEDGKTPYNNCLVEIWQCSPDGIYDNVSDEYKFRGAQKTGSDGKYHFTTTLPVPYLANEKKKTYRPAHIHMRVSGRGEQDLVTQIYLQGDPHLQEDYASKSPQAASRILAVKQNSRKVNEIVFDIVMAKEFTLDNAAFEKILGLYETEAGVKVEFVRSGDQLLTKLNGQYDEALYYKGNNSFADALDMGRVKFEPQQNSETKFTAEFRDDPGTDKWTTVVGKRILKYKS